MQADAHSGYNGLYVEGRQPGLIIDAACWAHSRRKLFELADFRDGELARRPLQQPDPEPLLQLQDSAAEFRLRNTERAAGRRIAAMVDDLDEVVEVVQIPHG